MKLSKIKFQPGIHREGTQYSAGPSWYDCDKVRFRRGRPEKMGGWTKYILDSYKGVCRSLYDWQTSASNKFLGIGTNLKFYVEYGSRLHDITPIRLTTLAGDVTFAIVDTDPVNNDPTILVTDATGGGHGAVLGDYVTFTQTTTLGGNITAAVLNQEYKITKKVSASTYHIEAKDPTTGAAVGGLTATDTGNGGTATIAAYQQNIGLNNYVPSTGWGTGPWSAGPWGGGGNVTFAGQLRLYSQDSFADDLLFNGYLGNLYFWDVDDNARITDAGDITFAAANGDATITVTHTAHGALAGDYVTFSGAELLGGGGTITAAILNQRYRIAVRTDVDTYTIEARDDTTGELVAANASDSGDGGTAVVGSYEAGRAVTLTNIATFSDAGDVTFTAKDGDETIEVAHTDHGASVGDYVTFTNATSFGGNINISVLNQRYQIATVVDDDNYTFEAKNATTGALVAANATDDPAGTGTAGGGAAIVGAYALASNPPTQAYQVMVSPVDRHVIAFGCNDELFGTGDIDPLLIRWGDQESILEWTPSAVNTAGGQVLSTGNRIIGAIKTRQEILVFTDSSIHAMRFVGTPFIYQFSVVGENITMISPKGGVSAGDAVFFMGKDGFYVFQGSVRRLPCSVLKYVFSNMDKSEIYKIFAISNPDDNEVTWFYPANGSGVDVTNYVTYNHEEDLWTIGTFARGAWTQAPTRNYPLASSNDTLNVETNYLYTQEYGDDAEGVAMGEFIESGEVSISDGDRFIMLQKIIPDLKFRRTTNNAALTLTIKKTDFPLIAPVTHATKTIESDTKQLHVRVRSREIVMRVDGTGTGYGWTMGDFRFGLRTSAKR